MDKWLEMLGYGANGRLFESPFRQPATGILVALMDVWCGEKNLSRGSLIGITRLTE